MNSDTSSPRSPPLWRVLAPLAALLTGLLGAVACYFIMLKIIQLLKEIATQL